MMKKGMIMNIKKEEEKLSNDEEVLRLKNENMTTIDDISNKYYHISNTL
jgi:hypothetical protein